MCILERLRLCQDRTLLFPLPYNHVTLRNVANEHSKKQMERVSTHHYNYTFTWCICTCTEAFERGKGGGVKIIYTQGLPFIFITFEVQRVTDLKRCSPPNHYPSRKGETGGGGE